MRFFFDYEGQQADSEGVELADLQDAERQAGQTLLLKLAEEGAPSGARSVSIRCDEHRRPLTIFSVSLIRRRF